MAAVGSEGKSEERPWTATSSWAPAGCSAVEDALSFETSDYDAEAAPSAVVLACPPSDGDGDPLPCEVTVNFRGKYEIHMVYVRSTARIYEIYYSTDSKDNSKDYLCTVRCGLAVKEPLPSGEESMTSSNAATSEKHENETKSVTSSSDEDSWVEVKIPESPVESSITKSQERNAIKTCQKNTLAHYEATAEITDANPCASLTVRLLSLQSKASVHIEEIYIFADPVDSANDDSVAGPGNMGDSSLLAMLVPGLMQMSKSRNMKINNRYFSDGLKTQLPEGCTMKGSSSCEKVAQEVEPCGTNDPKVKLTEMENRGGGSGTVHNEKTNQDDLTSKDPKPLLLPVQIAENSQVPLEKSQKISNTDQLANPLMKENFAYNHIEKKLDTLLSKVEKMEVYCSKFEDSMMRPLGIIDTRLQKLEQQFDSFSVQIQSLRGSSARVPVPDGQSDTTNKHEKTPNDGSSNTHACIINRQPGLVVRAPEFSLDASCGYDVTNENPVTLRGSNVPRFLVKAPDFICESFSTCEKLHDGTISSVNLSLSPEKERKITPGLAVKVPEFRNDEVDEGNEAETVDHDNGHAKSDDTRSKITTNNSKGKSPVSIDGALACALEAFLTSSKGMPPLKSVDCTASGPSAGSTDDSASCSVPPEKIDEICTKDGSASQVQGKCDDAYGVSTPISYEEADEAPHSSFSNANLIGKAEVNEENTVLNSDKMVFVESTEPLGVPSHPQTRSIYDSTQLNEQNAAFTSYVMPSVTSTEPLDAPQTPAVLESVDDGAQVKEKPPIVLESFGDTAQVNENMPALSLEEFLAASNASSCRNEASVVSDGNDDDGIMSSERTSARAAKNLEGCDSKASQKNDINQLLVLKKAFKINVHEGKGLDDISIDTTLEAPNFAAPGNVADRHGTNAMETVPDEDRGLQNTENSIRVSDGMDSLFCHLYNSKKGCIENISFHSNPSGSFTKSMMEHSWPDFSFIESFSGAPARESVSSGNTTTENSVENLFAGIGVSSTVTSHSGEELHKVYDMVHKHKDNIMSTSFVTNITSDSSPSLEVLLAESSDSEAQISDLEDTDIDAGIQLFSTFSSSDDASASSEPLADLAGLPIPSEAYDYATDDPLTDVIDLTNSSSTYASTVSEPLPDVVDLDNRPEALSSSANEPLVSIDDLPNPRDTYSSTADEPLVSVDDLPKPPETFAGGSSVEKHDSLI